MISDVAASRQRASTGYGRRGTSSAHHSRRKALDCEPIVAPGPNGRLGSNPTNACLKVDCSVVIEGKGAVASRGAAQLNHTHRNLRT